MLLSLYFLQPAGDSIGNCGTHAGSLVTPPMPATVEPGVATVAGASGASTARAPCFGDKLQLPAPPAAAATSNMGPPRDDGSSGYGSPDSETFESPQTTQ